MRLWHEDLIKKLPRQQLLGQHRECAALRGAGWGKAHSTVNYVFNHSPYKLYQYHIMIIDEMKNRGYKPDSLWENPLYRGKKADAYQNLDKIDLTHPVYPEHDDEYLKECLENLSDKGIYIE